MNAVIGTICFYLFLFHNTVKYVIVTHQFYCFQAKLITLKFTPIINYFPVYMFIKIPVF